jgi:hypothetical protein
MNDNQSKIIPDMLSELEYSEQVTARFCSLMKNKIFLHDKMKVIKALNEEMQPKTISNYKDKTLNAYNSVKGAIKERRIMFFEVGGVTFIPKQ